MLTLLFHFPRCPVDDTFRLHQTDSDTAIRFSITSFLFLRSNSRQFFMHCDVKICDKTDQLCLTGCNNAKKIFKSLYTRKTRNETETKGKLFFLILLGFTGNSSFFLLESPSFKKDVFWMMVVLPLTNYFSNRLSINVIRNLPFSRELKTTFNIALFC